MDEIESIGCIYLITNTINGKQYVGQTTQKVEQRWIQHICDASTRRKNYPLYNAINKYGEDKFTIIVLTKASSLEELNDLELYFIKEQNTTIPNGYNVRGGGGNRGKLHESTKKKISLAHSGKCFMQHTEEFKKKLKERSIGNKFALGRKQSIEEKEKHKVISAGYKRSTDGQFTKKQ